MKTRHRIPTIFSIYMVDVLCCALGCMILLWLVNFREAKRRTKAASEVSSQLARVQSALAVASADLAGARSALADSRSQGSILQSQLARLQSQYDLSLKDLAILKKTRDETAMALALSKKDVASLRIDLKSLQARAQAAETALADKTAAHESISKKLLTTTAMTRTLEKDLVAKSTRLIEADLMSKQLAKQLEDLGVLAKLYREKLTTADIRARLLEDDLSKGKKESVDLRKRYEDLLLAQTLLSRRLASNSKELEVARSAADSLKLEKLNLARQLRQIREAADNRFAGITLTGQNVLFLVDMSGSMEMLDENTADPDKWPEVCATIAKIMRSLPDLKQFQVILFSDKVRYPLGKEGKWLPFDLDTTPKAAFEAVKAVKPKGETNMAAVFEEAFRYRSEGLDTIYVLSDGLPNAGPGVPPGASVLSATQRIDYLGKYVRTRLRYVLNRPGPGQPRVRINTIGFFFESPEVGAFLWALAREHDGNFVGMNK
ncbi:MAG: VWA domain-containing protein [Planctomycetes bacterium]|nr:VWA domain-containing protein [Planctomycetota bacterium]